VNDVYLLYKERGETPLECIKRFQKDGALPLEKLTYAGRLDPAAGGLLLVLGGEERFEKEKYTALPKVYEADILFGVSSDTYDLLGIPEEGDPISLEELQGFFPQFEREVTSLSSLPYPPYSSRTVEGKPLWALARSGAPSHSLSKNISVTSFEVLSSEIIDSQTILDEVRRLVTIVRGDFRQDQIIRSWKGIPSAVWVSMKCRIACSSGTYIRSIAHHLGLFTHTGALARSITRTDIGPYSADNALRKVDIASSK
jgi:tRNA pseudouridine55 synthase